MRLRCDVSSGDVDDVIKRWKRGEIRPQFSDHLRPVGCGAIATGPLLPREGPGGNRVFEDSHQNPADPADREFSSAATPAAKTAAERESAADEDSPATTCETLRMNRAEIPHPATKT